MVPLSNLICQIFHKNLEKKGKTKSRITNIEIVGRGINIHTKSNRGKKWKERKIGLKDSRLKATKSMGKNNYWANFVHLCLYVGEGKMLIENNVG